MVCRSTGHLRPAARKGLSIRPGRGDIPTTVRALKAGAVDFLTKPVGEMELLDAIARAKIEDAKARQLRADLAAVRKKISTLSPRELEVLLRAL